MSPSILIVWTHLYLSLAEDVAQVREHLPSKCEDLSFIPSTSVSPNTPILGLTDTDKPESTSLVSSLLFVPLPFGLQNVLMAAFLWR